MTMNEIKKEIIRQLAVDAHRKREAVAKLQTAKVPTDAKEKENHAVDFAWAMTESLEADHLLKAEMYPFGVRPVEPQDQA